MGNGDAKLYGNNKIATSVGGKFTMIDFKQNKQICYEDVPVNWLDIDESSNSILYANFNNQVGVLTLDENMNITKNDVIFSNDELAIDPSITKVNDTYYITLTFIKGNVNNSDPNTENGSYVIKLFTSKNLHDFNYIGDIVSEQKNLEDVVSLYSDGKFYIFYEEEEIDKGNSKLKVTYSSDKGISWSKSVVLCDLDADNEIGNVIEDKDGFTMYFSSDVLCKGKSYNGASIFMSRFDKNFVPIFANKQISYYNGALLYDVIPTDDGGLFLYTQKYLTESNLVLSHFIRSKDDFID